MSILQDREKSAATVFICVRFCFKGVYLSKGTNWNSPQDEMHGKYTDSERFNIYLLICLHHCGNLMQKTTPWSFLRAWSAQPEHTACELDSLLLSRVVRSCRPSLSARILAESLLKKMNASSPFSQQNNSVRLTNRASALSRTVLGTAGQCRYPSRLSTGTAMCTVRSLQCQHLYSNNICLLSLPVSVLGVKFHIAVYKIQVCTHKLRVYSSTRCTWKEKKMPRKQVPRISTCVCWRKIL